MTKSLSFFTSLSMLLSFGAIAYDRPQCDVLFPANEPIHVNGTLDLDGSVNCYDSTDVNPDEDACSASNFTPASPVIPSDVSCSGTFGTSDKNLTGGTVQCFTDWDYNNNKISVSGSGTAVVYIKKSSGDITIKKKAKINEGGNPGNLLIVLDLGDGIFKIEEGNKESKPAEINAFMYIASKDGDNVFEKWMDYSGHLTVEESLQIKEESTYTYHSSDNLSFDNGFCQGTAPEPAELIAKYKLEENSWSSASSILDSSGNNNHASPLGSILSALEDPISCQAVEIPENTGKGDIDAIDTGVDVNTLGNQGSIAFWYRNNTKWDDISNHRVLFDATTSSDAQFFMFIWDNGYLEFEATGPDGNYIEWYIDKKTFAADTWVHIVLTWDATKDEIQMYVNGVSETVTKNHGGDLDSGLHTDIGTLLFGDNSSAQSALGRSADGDIDEIHLYKNVLTQAEVSAIYVDTSDCINSIPEFSCENTFVDGATSHSASGSVNLAAWSYVFYNPDSVLQSPAVNNAGNTATCRDTLDGDVQNCSASGSATTSMSLGTFQTTASTDRHDITNTTSVTIGESGDNEFYVINVEAGGTLNTSTASSTYYIRSLFSYGSQARINFAPGDYYIEYLTIGSGTLINITEPGEVRLFVKNAFTVGSFSELNHQADSDRQLHIASWGDISVDTGSRVQALLYSEGTLSINASAHVYGAVSAVNSYIAADGRVYYECGTSAPIVDHYLITHDGSGLTCEAENITVQACTNAFDGTCTESSEIINLKLVATGASATVEQLANLPTDPSGDPNVALSYVHDETVSLSIADETVSAINGFYCNNGGVGSCDIVFDDTGFIFSSDSGELPVIPTQLSGKPSDKGFNTQSLFIQAVKTDDITGSCVGVFPDGGDVPVNLSYTCHADSASCTNNLQLTNNSSVKSLTTSLASHDLRFTADSKAYFSLNYPDAGKLILNAQKTIDLGNNITKNFNASSNEFVVRPFGLYLDFSNDSNGTNAFASDADGTVFKKAGETFTLTATAKQWVDGQDDDFDGEPDDFSQIWDNPVANYFEGEKLTVSPKTVTPSELDGASLGSLNKLSDNTFNSSQVDNNYNYSEVGVIELNANLFDSDYLGGGDVLGQVTNVGRFTPDHFEISTVSNGIIVNSSTCNLLPKTFTYIGEMDESNPTNGALTYDVEPEFTLIAKSSLLNDPNDAGSGYITTQNYSGAFNKINDSRVVRVTPAKDGTKKGSDNGDLLIDANLSSSVNTETGNFTGEQVIRYSVNDHFVYPREANTKIIPFITDINLIITSIIDEDLIDTLDFDEDDNTEFPNSILNLHPTGTSIRFGRWRIDNAYGPETEDLPVPMYIEQWDGAAGSESFQVNSDESCVVPNFGGKVTSGSLYDSLTAWQYRLLDTTDGEPITPADSGVTAPDPLTLFSSGNYGDFIFTQPDVRGSLQFELEVPEWLKYDWQDENNGTFNDNPSAIVSFGLFRGNDRIISWREVGN